MPLPGFACCRSACFGGATWNSSRRRRSVSRMVAPRRTAILAFRLIAVPSFSRGVRSRPGRRRWWESIATGEGRASATERRRALLYWRGGGFILLVRHLGHHGLGEEQEGRRRGRRLQSVTKQFGVVGEAGVTQTQVLA